VTSGREYIEVKNVLTKLEEKLEIARRDISEDPPTLDGSTFNKETFWKNFIAATKLISHEATKFCMMFSKPPLPSQEECQKLADKIESTCFSFIAVFFTLPKSKGKLLHRDIRYYVISVLQGMKELCTAAKNHSTTQLQTVGNVWEKCEAVENLPKDNRDAVVSLCRGEHDVVQDASQELMDALENDDDSSDEFFVPRVNGLSVPNSSWTDSDRHVLLPCSGLIKATKACLKKTLLALSERGNGDDERCISELDNIADIVKMSSSNVDDFVLSLYPPMNHTAVKDQASIVRNTCKDILSCVRGSHFCSQQDEEWVTFLEKAVDHNWLRISDLVLAD